MKTWLPTLSIGPFSSCTFLQFPFPPFHYLHSLFASSFDISHAASMQTHLQSTVSDDCIFRVFSCLVDPV
jgi:hypothetical protein